MMYSKGNSYNLKVQKVSDPLIGSVHELRVYRAAKIKRIYLHTILFADHHSDKKYHK